MVEALASKGADLNAKDRNGEAPLIVAISQAKTESVKVLLAKGADVNANNKEGATALMEAIILLKKAGARQ